MTRKHKTRTAITALTLAALAAITFVVSPAAAGRTATATEVRRVHFHWLTRSAAGDATACRLITERLRFALVNPDDCACFYMVGNFADTLTPEQRAAFARVSARRIDLQRRRARVHDHDLQVPTELAHLEQFTNDRPMVLVREGGRWRIDRLG